MLGLYEYNALNIDQRADLLWKDGAFITATDNAEGRSAFYTLADFYVEIVMRESDFFDGMKQQKAMKIAEIVPFKVGHRLDRLSSVVDLSTL